MLDESKFGKKLMEKMGWSEGKGLGAKEQGDVNHVSVRHKDDNKGIGFEGHDDTWIAHQDEFAAVLAELNQTHGDGGAADGNVSGDKEAEAAEAKSLEKKSKTLKKRVHYMKFTRGKDLSRYSSKDLDCILGSDAVQKKREEDKKERQRVEDAKSAAADTDVANRPVGFASSTDADNGTPAKISVGEVEKSHGLVTITGGSVNDYFAKKMAALKRARSGEVAEESVEAKDKDESPAYEAVEAVEKDKKKKKRKKEKLDEMKSEPEKMSKNEKKSKKTKKSSDNEESNSVLEETTQEETISPVSKKEKKKKKGKRKLVESSEVETVKESEEPTKQKKRKDMNSDNTDEEPKKAKKQEKAKKEAAENADEKENCIEVKEKAIEETVANYTEKDKSKSKEAARLARKEKKRLNKAKLRKEASSAEQNFGFVGSNLAAIKSYGDDSKRRK